MKKVSSELSVAIRSYVEGQAELEFVEPEQTGEIAHDVSDRYVLNRGAMVVGFVEGLASRHQLWPK